MIELKDNKVLQNYIQELEKDVKLDLANLREKSLMCSSIWAKWLSYLYQEKETAERIQNAKSKILKSKLKDTSSKDTVSVLRLKTEDKLSENDEKIQKLNRLAKQTADNIDYIERALTILQSFGFNIKNVTDILRLNMEH